PRGSTNAVTAEDRRTRDTTPSAADGPLPDRLPRPGPPEQAADPEFEDDLERHVGFVGVDLRDARAAVLEADRGLADPAADLAAPEEDLLHEGVAARADPAEVDLGELRDPVTAETPAVVLRRQAQEQPGVQVDARAHEFALEVKLAP